MPTKQLMRDLIIVIPGIMGSVLELDGKIVWGPGAILPNLFSLGREVNRLKVAANVGHQAPNDGVRATALMPDLHLLPGVWTIDGYGKLLRFLRERFDIYDDPPNLIAFPYDWRLSNAVAAKQLAEIAIPALERWRRYSPESESKLVLICHSMGGLVARYFLENLGGREHTRSLITIGTPYQGSINALDAISNGLKKGLGPLQLDLSEFARSLPSLHELLPTYPCVEGKTGVYCALNECAAHGIDVPELSSTRVKAALDFHRSAAPASVPPYRIFAIKGNVQPTAQSVQVTAAGVTPIRSYKGQDRSGDGTVPRPSSHPPEWEGETGSTLFAAQKHGSLQNTDGVLDQIFGILTQQLGTWMGGISVAVDAPDVISRDVPLEILARPENGDDSLPLRATLEGEDGTSAESDILENLGRGEYRIAFRDLPSGAYRITIDSADSDRPVDPVTSISLIC